MAGKHALGAQIQTLRKERGLTQETLAERIGRSVEFISNIERGISSPTVETLEQFGEQFGVPVTAFFELSQVSANDRDRAVKLARLADLARRLDTPDLALALEQVEAIARRSGKQET